jgi:hypothetical protein
MALSKPSKKPAVQAKKPAPKKQPAPAAAAPAYDPNKDRRALRELVARHGHVDAEHRAAYDELIGDPERAELGGKTRAAGVFREGIAWAVQIGQAFTQSPALVKDHYAESRFAYFLDRLAALDATLAAQAERRGDQNTTRSSAADRESLARDARRTLLAKLRGFAGRRDIERAALETATGRIDDENALGDSIRALAKLGRSWLARGDAKAKIQCASAGLTESVVNAALEAAEALTGAATAATLAGRRPAIDAPEVNLVEGAVLHEMEEAARCFEEAHKATQVVPRLTPGPATRHVLGSKRSAKAAPAPSPASPAPSAPETNPNQDA